MTVLISGGSKNGKTAFSESVAMRLSGNGRRYYVATMIPYDEEDRRRVALHIEERAGKGFETLEIGRDIASALEKGGPDAVYLVDSVTALLLNEMFPDFSNPDADPRAAARCREGLLALAKGAAHTVFVSDYIYSDAARYDAFTENYRRDLASIDRALAEAADTVIELSAGIPIFHKGGLPE